jgi:peptide/nickel transport system substrate-binding protein
MRRGYRARFASFFAGVCIVSMIVAACGGAPASPTAAPKAAEPTKPAAAAPTTAPAAAATATTAPAAKPAEATKPAAAATPAPAAKAGELKPVPRNRTLIVMQGGDNGQNPEFKSFNNQVTGANFGWHTGALQTMAEPLIMFNVLTGDYENWLAESWQYNADFTEITMKLRKGIEWSDGKPFTARDVVFTYNLVRDKYKEMVHTADIAVLKETVYVDDLNLKFVLKQPSPTWWATTLTTNHGITEQIFPEHIWKDQDPLKFTFYDPEKGWPIGTGPYKLVQTTAEQKVFDLRPDWWAVKTGFKPLPKVERVIYIPNRDETQAAQMLISNQVDMAKILTVPTLKSVMAQNPKVVTFTGQNPPYGYLDWCPIMLGFNDEVAPYNDKDIRFAINYALDREKLVQLAEAGAGVTAFHQFTPYAWFQPFENALKPLYEKYGLSTKAARDKTDKIMTDKGWKKGGDSLWEKDGKKFDMKIFVPDWLKAYGPPLTQQLKEAGFNATFDTSPGLATEVQTGNQAAYFGCVGPSGVKGMDPYFMLSIYHSQYYRPTGQPAASWWATGRWKNAEYDKLVDAIAPLKVEDPKTVETFAKAMDIWFSEMPMVFVSQLIIRYPMSTEYWTGWPSDKDVYGFPHSWQAEFLKTIIKLQPTK